MVLETKALKAGREAYLSEQRITENPYSSSQYESYLEWQTGWLDEQQLALVKVMNYIGDSFGEIDATIIKLGGRTNVTLPKRY